MTGERSATSFDGVAELYDRARPTYPPALLDDLVELAGLRVGAKVLEIGCGTGQATVALLERGLDVLCVERGPRLAAVARRNGVSVEVARFEHWEGEPRSFDAVASFTAWHWVDAAVKYERAARLLRDGGALAVVTTQHVVLDDREASVAELREEYESAGWSGRPPHLDELEDLVGEIEESGYFRDVTIRRHLARHGYTADAFLDVVGTYSDHLALDPTTRERLHTGLRRRIEERLAGTVVLDYAFTLHVARRS